MAPRLLAGAAATVATLIVAPDSPPARPTCSAEDMVPFYLADDAYGHKAGELRCIHVDQTGLLDP